MRKVLPINHPDINDLFENSTRVLPDWHIDLTELLYVSKMEKVLVPRGHPNPQKMYTTQELPPQNHPMITTLLEPFLPPDHPENLDEMLRNPADFPLPGFHPNLASFLQLESITEPDVNAEDEQNVKAEDTDYYDSLFTSSLEGVYDVPTFSVFFDHPNIDEDYEIGDPIDHHPSVYYMFEEYLPDGHPNIDVLMARGFVLPSYHPDIRNVVEQRSLATSPASLLSYCIASIVVLVVLIRNAGKLRRRTEEIPPPPMMRIDDSIQCTLSTHTESDNSNKEIVEVEAKFEGTLPRLDHRHNVAIELNHNHRDSDLGPQEDIRENILAYKEKKSTFLRSTWKNAFGRRILKSDISTGEVFNCFLYVLINIVALVMSPSYQYPIGLGSLSAGNTLFLVMTA